MVLPLAVDYTNGNLVRTDTGLSTAVRARVLDVVSVLLDTSPNYASIDRLAIRLGPAGEPLSNEAVVNAVCRTRKCLALLGASIVTKYDAGYRIEIDGEAGVPIILPAAMRSALSRLATKSNTSIDDIVARQVSAALAQEIGG